MGDRTRYATADDAAAVCSIYGPIVRDTPISFEIESPSPDEMQGRIRTSVLWLVRERSGEVVGYAYVDRFRSRPAYRWSLEVSVYIAEHARRTGVGSSLLTTSLTILAGRGFVNAFAGIALPNPASIALFESLGFEPTGVHRQVGFKLGAWHDVGWWQRRLRAATIPPPEICATAVDGEL
jgi:L-amino acid N-acyltransferase YncA